MAMKLYGCANSRSLRAAWALEHAGARYDYVAVDLFGGEARRPPFLAINPAGKVPVLVDGDLSLTESLAIVTYVGEKFPHSGLVPRAPVARGEYFRWCSFVVTEVEQPLWAIAQHRFILPKERRLPALEPLQVEAYARAAALLARRLEGRAYLLDEGFSGADILAAHTLAWARSARVPSPSPVLDGYLERLNAAPALMRARERERERATAHKPG